MLVLFFLELRTVMRHCLLTFLYVTFVTKHLRLIVMSRMKKHRRCHFEGKYQCHICGKKYKTPGNRNVHLRQVHGDAKFDCNFCDKSYQSQAALKKHVKKKHAGEEDLQERQLEEDPDLTLEAPEVGEEMDVHLDPEEIQEMTLHVVHGDSSQMNDCSVIISTECAVQEVEEQEGVLILPDMETETQASTAISDTEDSNTDFNTVYSSCFHESSHSSDNNNGASGEHNCSIKVRIGDGDEFLTINGKEELVVTASVVLHDYFYGTLPAEESEESNDTAAALPGPALTLASPEAEEMDTEDKPSLVSDVGSDYTGYTGAEETQEAAVPAEETEAVTGAQDEVAGDDADNKAVEAEKSYKCTVCTKTFKSKAYYRHHHRSHLFGPEWKCYVCEKSFSHKCILKQHKQQMHASDEDKILCPHAQCGKRFRSKTNLKHHMVVHDKKEENYSTELKQEALQLIKKHGNKAEAARRLKVSYSTIKRWERQSSKTFSCSFCGKELSEMSKLRQHEKKMHGNNPSK